MIYSKGFKNEFEKAQVNYIKAKVNNDNIEEIAKECKQKVLNENVFLEEETEERILKPNADFLMGESDFEQYCKLVYEQELKRGLEVPSFDTTANYQTRPALLKAENELLEMGLKAVKEEDLIKKGSSYDQLRRAFNITKSREEFLNLYSTMNL
jgi:hypothetical protein